MNPERLKKLQAQAAQVRIGGKGTPRRKKKIVHQSTATDDKKLQSTLKKLAVNTIQGIEEVNMYKNDGTVIHFNNPRTQASLSSNTFAITGHADVKNIAEMLKQLGGGFGGDSDAVNNLKQMAKSLAANSRVLHRLEEDDGRVRSTLDDDDIPDLVQNFEDQISAKVLERIERPSELPRHPPPTEIVD